MTNEPKLARKEVRDPATVPPRPCAPEDLLAIDPLHHLTPTPMPHLIGTTIPRYQPQGELVVPSDDWAALAAVIREAGGALAVQETTKRGFIYGDHQGLPCYQLQLTFEDDETDPRAALAQVDPALKALIARNCHPVAQVA